MEKCACGERAHYLCKPCEIHVCREHKIMHDKEEQRKHKFQELGKKLNAAANFDNFR